ncbi:MAG: hypothetical protein H6658_05900 [Ardenticatenaceae bacterium]|nr:hypothetical protein [Ardenticatenaceae bacterium]
MKTKWIPTNEYYHQILDAPDGATRQQLYVDCLMRPWQPMMAMFGNDPSDPLAGARRWNWLLPDQVEEIADLLAQLETADAWTIGQQAIHEGAARFSPYQDRIPFDTVEGWLMLADPARSYGTAGGYTGATDWLEPRFVGQYWEPNEYNLRCLPGLVVHEMHHLIRFRLYPWDMMKTSVADYVVLEGMAESMATAVFGPDVLGFYVTQADTAALDTARQLIGANLEATGFNTIRGYIFGDDMAAEWGFEPVGGMPQYGGYAVGYHLVQAFLQRTGLTIEEATFLPTAEIVAGSGFFDS